MLKKNLRMEHLRFLRIIKVVQIDLKSESEFIADYVAAAKAKQIKKGDGGKGGHIGWSYDTPERSR